MTTPSPLITGPATDVPLVLFPVRLETRLMTDPPTPQLLVRIYVDDLVVDSHETGLTDTEVSWGQHFWQQAWRAGVHQAAEHAAWDQLANMFGAPRARYIAETLQPTNTAQRPTAATPDDQPLPVAPVFPTPPTRSSAWTRAPQTNVMPDRWVAIVYVGGQRYTFAGNPIRDPLIVGLAPGTTGVDATSLASDRDAGWLVDFSAALTIGMALQIPITWLPVNATIDRLLVIGTRAALSRSDSQARLQGLIRAQTYTQGVSFVSQGTPSNNTPDVSSGFDSRATSFASSPLAQADWPVLRSGDGSNRDILSKALGINNGVLAGLDGAGTPEQRDAYHMNTALWRATWGYYLEQLMAGAGSPTDDAIYLGRLHFSNYVRARGPLPALRFGIEPYGVLPVMSLDRWQSREGTSIDAPLVRFVRALRDVWRRSLTNVPSLPGSSDPVTDLLRILAMSPTASGYAAHPAQAPVRWPAQTTPASPVVGSSAAHRIAQQLGLGWVPRQVHTIFSTYLEAAQVTGGRVLPPVTSSPQLPATELLSDVSPVDYVAALANASLAQLRTPASTVPTLLYVLLRHAALLEYAAAAYRIRLRQGQVTAGARAEPDVVGSQLPTPWDLLTQSLAGQDPLVTSTYLDGIKAGLLAEVDRDLAPPGAIWRRALYDVSTATGNRATDLREFAAFSRGMTYLGRRPSAVVARLLTETLDLSSHRLDAWATSFATKRLEWLRSTSPNGVYFGGYGLVEALQPTPRTSATPPPIPTGESAPELQTPLYQSPANKGYLHTPSIAHATSAAILRSGYLSRQASNDGQVLAVNVSSARVRTAQWILDGVRQGQSLSTLLGYRFERGLHEHHPELVLDRYIPAFRQIAPLDLPPPTDPRWLGDVQAKPAGTIVDGLALLTRFRSSSNSPLALPWGAGNLLPTVGSAAYTACMIELQRLDDNLDAITDLVTAEAVHQVAFGNTLRAGATLEAIAHGEAPPPDMDVVRTPRTGVGLTHRLMIVLQDGGAPTAWGSPSPRARSEPFLNAWAARLLGSGAATASCTVEYLESQTGQPLQAQGAPMTREVTLGDPALGLSPLDVVYLPEASAAGQWSELEQRVAYVALRSPPGPIPATASVRLTFSRSPGAPALPLRFAEVLEPARAVRHLVASARVLGPRDFATPDATLPDNLNADQPPAGQVGADPDALLRLSSRADAASRDFQAAAKTLSAPLAGQPDLDALRTQMLLLSAFGISGAVPLYPIGSGDPITARLTAQAASVAAEANSRVQRLLAVEATSTGATETAAGARDYHLARLQCIFGNDFRVLPRFQALNATTLRDSFASSDSLQAGNPLECVTWFQRISRVRANAALLNSSLMYAEVLGGSDGVAFRVGQLPYQAGDRWVGLPLVAQPNLPPDAPPPALPAGKLSLVVHAPTGFDATAYLAGLLVEDWTEVVPSAEETTGFVFHCDQPHARAPQAILLAVAADTSTAWTLEALEATLLETIDLSRLRSVDLNALGEVTQYLPAQMLVSNSPSTTIAADFAPITTS
jgi:hypothetical protein